MLATATDLGTWLEQWACTSGASLEQWLRTIVSMGPAVGPLLGGIGLLITAAAAWTTYVYYYRRTRDAAWLDRYRVLYGEFWKEERIAKIRAWISSDLEYAKLAPILSKRLQSARNEFDATTNNTLEELDYFCSILLRIEFFDRNRMTREQKALWYETFEKYWLAKIRER